MSDVGFNTPSYDDKSYTTLKNERRHLLEKIRTFEKSFRDMVEDGEAFFSYSEELSKTILELNGFEIWPEYCDGQILVVRWRSQSPHSDPIHVHKESSEILVLEKGKANLILLDKDRIITLEEDGRRIAYLRPNEAHSLSVVSENASGYAILVPPDEGLIQENGRCKFVDTFGVCKGNKALCQYR